MWRVGIAVLLCAQTACGWGSNKDKVLMDSVKTLTLYPNAQTTGRRSSPVPQMKCTGGECYRYTPSAVQCSNRGSDGSSTQWECKAELPEDLQLSNIHVSCEGYDYPEDPYILKGSCGLEYQLRPKGSGAGYQRPSYSSPGSFSFGNIIMFIIMAAVAYGLLKKCVGQRPPAAQAAAPGGPRLYPTAPPAYEGDENDRGGAPPPYTPHDGPGGGYKYTGQEQAGQRPNCQQQQQQQQQREQQQQQQQQAQGPGFWSGAGVGAALGYLFGNRGNTGTHYGAQHHPNRHAGGGGFFGGNRGWGGGGGGGGFFGGNRGWGAGWGGGGRARSNRGWGGTTSTPTTTSTGFGGTSRR